MRPITVLLLALTAAAGASDFRQPAVNPDGSQIVFCYRGDIWTSPVTGGVIRCLVPGESMDYAPSYSPDGSYLAYTSEITGDGDVYVLNLRSGDTRRLTYHGRTDRVISWTAGSDSVLFTTSREGGSSWLYSVPLEGGTPIPAAKVMTDNACLIPGGLAIERGYTNWWRKHYEGSAARRIWTGSVDNWETIDDSRMDSRWPMFSELNDQLLFVREDGGGHGALWSWDLSTGECIQRTFLTQGDVTFPAVSQDGSTVVFEYRGGLSRLSTSDWSVSPIPLVPAVASAYPLEYGETVGFSTDSYALDSSRVQIALVGFGDLFAGTLEDGDIVDLKEIYSGSWRARDPVFSPDGKQLAFTLEHDGILQLALALGENGDSILTASRTCRITTLETASDVAAKPLWSPDGNRLAYLDRDSRLHVYSVSDGRDIEVCGLPDIIHHSWSPDGRWLAFSVPVLAHREEVFIVPSGGGEPRNVSRHPNDDFQPLWSSDGRRLLFASRTDDGDYSIKQIWFRREDWDADDEERDELIDTPLSRVEIQWEDIQRRTETLCTLEGYYDFFGISPNGRIIALPGWDDDGSQDLWTVDWKGDDLQRLTFSGQSPSRISVTESGTVYFISLSGSIRSISATGGSASTLGWSMPVWRSVPEIQAQKFDEAWRLLRDNFYDPDMHQVDWDSIRTLYRERAASSILNREFNDVVSRMLGELSASHLRIYGPWSYDGSPSSSTIGIIPEHDWAGPGIRVDSIIPYSPADLEGSRLYPGDVILSVEGIDVGPKDNLYRALLQRRGLDTRLVIQREGSRSTVDIEPVSIWAEESLMYDEWIHRNRRRIDRNTGGRVGYLHIPSMNNRSVANFLVDLFAEGMDRDGLIIDIRGNGGGSTHDEILRHLGRPTYLYSTDRYGNITFEPLGVWQKPMVLLINETCYSDAEIFPAGWKQLDLGPVVGETTFGAVIGTSDVTLVDGTGFRLPATGWFTLGGENLENSGVEPDIRVPEMPQDAGNGVDRQLDRAMEVITEML